MFDQKNFKDLITTIFVIAIFLLAAIIISPIIVPIIFGILAGTIFFPIYSFVLKKLKNENISAFSVCMGLFLSIFSIIIAVLNSLVSQAIDLYLSLQNINLTQIFGQILPNFFSSSELTVSLAGSLNTFITAAIANFLNGFTSLIINLPIRIRQLVVFLFSFFFSLKDGKRALD